MRGILLIWAILLYVFPSDCDLPAITRESASSRCANVERFPPPRVAVIGLPPIDRLVERIDSVASASHVSACLRGSRSSVGSVHVHFTDSSVSAWPEHLKVFYGCFPESSNSDLKKSLVHFIDNRFGEMLKENPDIWLLIKPLIKITPFTTGPDHQRSFVDSRHRLLLLQSYASTGAAGIFTYDQALHKLKRFDASVDFGAIKRYKIFFLCMSVFAHQIALAKDIWDGVFLLDRERLKCLTAILVSDIPGYSEIISAVLREAFQVKTDWGIQYLLGFARGYSAAKAA